MFRLLRPRRRTLVNSLIEAVLIVFSVLVALAANRWRDQHEARQRLDVAEQHIRIELEQNRAILQNIIPYHEAEVQRMGEYLAQPDLADKVRRRALSDLLEQLMPRGFWNPGVSPSALSDSAWQSAIATNTVSLMNLPLLNKLTAYYALQNNGVQHTLQVVGQQFLLPSTYDPNSTILMLRTSQGWFSELASEEQELLAYTNDTLKALPSSGHH